MDIPNYKEVTYKELQRLLWKEWLVYSDNGGNGVKLAIKLRVKSSQTAKNVFNPNKQMVSDEILTATMDCIGVDGFVIWNNRKRSYFISQNNYA